MEIVAGLLVLMLFAGSGDSQPVSSLQICVLASCQDDQLVEKVGSDVVEGDEEFGVDQDVEQKGDNEAEVK